MVSVTVLLTYLITHQLVEKDQVLAIISDPFGNELCRVLSLQEGVVIGKQHIPLAQEDEALYHIAYFRKPDSVAEHLELLQDDLNPLNDTNEF